jgi:molybdenum cofactor cytidylyltransferase
VLAAGRSSRMGNNKLLVELAGKPLVRHAVEAVLASPARPVVVVTGNEAERVRAALAGCDVTFVHNPAFASGMASSLRAGIAAVPEAAGALVCLGDMPRVTAAHLGALRDAYRAANDEGAIVVPTCERKRGNPVLWGRRRFAEIATLDGDVGARALIDRYPDSVRWLAIDDPAILVDVDTPEALASLQP